MAKIKKRRISMPKTRIMRYALIFFLLLPLITFAQTDEIKKYKIIKGRHIVGYFRERFERSLPLAGDLERKFMDSKS